MNETHTLFNNKSLPFWSISIHDPEAVAPPFKKKKLRKKSFFNISKFIQCPTKNVILPLTDPERGGGDAECPGIQEFVNARKRATCVVRGGRMRLDVVVGRETREYARVTRNDVRRDATGTGECVRAWPTSEGELDRAPETASGLRVRSGWRRLSPATRTATATTTTTTPTPTPLAATMARRRSALIRPAPPLRDLPPAEFHLASIPMLVPGSLASFVLPFDHPCGAPTPHYSIDPTGEALWCVPFAWLERRLRIALA